jgi:hypothetical protein
MSHVSARPQIIALFEEPIRLTNLPPTRTYLFQLCVFRVGIAKPELESCANSTWTQVDFQNHREVVAGSQCGSSLSAQPATLASFLGSHGSAASAKATEICFSPTEAVLNSAASKSNAVAALPDPKGGRGEVLPALQSFLMSTWESEAHSKKTV